MKKPFAAEVLPELLSEFVFVALLVVGVMLFFLWVTRARPQPRLVAARVPVPRPAPAPEALEDESLGERVSLTA